MSIHIDTNFEWPRLRRFCEEVWAGRNTHNRDRNFYEYLRRQPTLTDGEAAIVQVAADDGGVEGLLAFLKFQWQGKTIYSALNWYTRPRQGLGMHGALLLRHWSQTCEVMVAAHPRSHLVAMFTRADWKRLDVATFWWPVQTSGLLELWPGRRHWRQGLRMMAKGITIRGHRLLPTTYQIKPAVYDSSLTVWFEKLGRTYDFFARPASRLAWQYGSWQPRQQHFLSYSVYSPSGEMVGFFVLRTGKRLAVVCELFALPGHWRDVLICAQNASATQPEAALLRLRTNVPECITACRHLGWVLGLPAANFFKCQDFSLDPHSSRFIFSTGDSDEYLL